MNSPLRADALRTVLPGSIVTRCTDDDVPELVVVQRCCWVSEAIANDTLDIPPLHETAAQVRMWSHEWETYVVRLGPRLVGAFRYRVDGTRCDIGRLMVVPDLAGRGIGTAMLRAIEDAAAPSASSFAMFTGARSTRNIRTYERAGYAVTRRERGLVFLTKNRPLDEV